jgi:hypothetical protein
MGMKFSGFQNMHIAKLNDDGTYSTVQPINGVVDASISNELPIRTVKKLVSGWEFKLPLYNITVTTDEKLTILTATEKTLEITSDGSIKDTYKEVTQEKIQIIQDLINKNKLRIITGGLS